MVRFTLKDGGSDSSIRLDLPKEDSISELTEIVADHWGLRDMVLLRGYDLLRGGRIGEILRDGDVVEMIPDPKGLLRTESFESFVPVAGAWSEGSGRMRTS